VKFVKGPAIDEISDSAGEKFPIVSLDRGGTDIGEFIFPEKFLLISGSEGQGLPQGLRRNSVSIPVSDTVESLNATVALSLFIYEWSKRKIN
jgi:tRNA G18 (ribose-2'-O)-methylase SpoU